MLRDWVQENRLFLLAGLLLLAFLLLVLSTGYFSGYISGYGNLEAISTGFWLMVVGVLALWGALALRQRPITLRQEEGNVSRLQDEEIVQPERARWWMVFAGALLLFLLAESNAEASGLISPPPEGLQLLGFVMGIALVTAGLIGNRWLRPRLGWQEGLFLLGLTLAALGLRFWNLDTNIQHFIDEANFAYDSMRFRDEVTFTEPTLNFKENGPVPVISPHVLGSFSSLFTYMQHLLSGIFGQNLTGFRAFSAITGALTVPALYLLGRSLFDRSTAMLGALILLSLPPHLHFSQLGLNNITDPLFGTLAIAFMVRGELHNRRMDYVLCGVSLGMTQYFYEGGRLLYPALILLWMGKIFLTKSEHRGHILLAALATVLVAMPFFYTLYHANTGSLTPRATYSRIELDQEYFEILEEEGELDTHLRLHAQQTFLVYVHASEMNVTYRMNQPGIVHLLVPHTFYYGDDRPLLLEFLVPFFLMGVAYVAYQWRSPAVAVLLLWVLLTSVGNMQSWESAKTPRYVVVMPALALLTAVGVRVLLDFMFSSKKQFRLVVGIMVVLGLVASVLQANYYFNEHLEDFNQDYRRIEPGLDGMDAVFRSLDFPPGTHIYILGSEAFNTFQAETLLEYHRDDLALWVVMQDNLAPFFTELTREEGDADFAFYIAPRDKETRDLLASYFELSPPQYSPNPDVPQEEQMVLYYVKR
jgi:4-amino-4-deoxy-L-arabinose transferase-like glycosyltransferase